MPNKIQFRRGNVADLPSLDAGEPGVATDTQDLYFGSGSGNIQVAKKSYVDGKFPITSSEINLDTQATASGNAVRWNEFSLKHNNDGSFKGIDQTDLSLSASASATKQAVRWDEFSLKHNNDGSFKGIDQADMNLTSSATATKKPVRWDEFSARHNNSGTIKQQMFNKSQASNPASAASTYGTAVTNTPPTNYTAVVPLGVNVVFGGAFGSETVTAQITVTYSDATTASITKTATATGTTTLNTTDFLSLVKDGLYITQISFASESTIASSAATVTFNRYGFYM